MIDTIDLLVDDYYSWMRLNTLAHFEQSTDWGLISTPFVGLNNDHIAIAVKVEGEDIYLSDDGDTLGNLLLEGVVFDQRSKTRLRLQQEILRNYGVQINGQDELIRHCQKEHFPQAAHDFVQAIKELSDLHVLGKSNVSHIFNDDVRAYFDDLDIFYSEELFLKSKDNLSVKYDFIIPKRHSEILVRSFNRVHEGFIKQFFYDSDSVAEGRRKDCVSLAIINDTQVKPDRELLNAIGSRPNTQFLLWSERLSDEGKKLLVA